MISCLRRTIRRICSRISCTSPACKGLGARTTDLGGFTTDTSGGGPRNFAACFARGWGGETPSQFLLAVQKFVANNPTLPFVISAMELAK